MRTRTLLIGHRGVGKTSLLRRIAGYAPAARCIDLDEELARMHGVSTRELFERCGESTFRQLEERALQTLLGEPVAHDAPPQVLALGAGYCGALPNSSPFFDELRVIWVARPSDERGRIFFDRPRLDPATDPLTEFHQRRKQRTPRYRALATDAWLLLEGAEAGSPEEADFFLDRLVAVGGIETLLPEVAQRPARLLRHLGRRMKWGVRAIELRDDLLDAEQLQAAARGLTEDRRLVSFRSASALDQTLTVLRELGAALWDWPVELGACPRALRELRGRGVGIASLHARAPDEPLTDAIARLEAHAEHCGATLRKLAVPVFHLGEIADGHAWSLVDPRRNVFLPCDPATGRFSWYRLFRGDGPTLAFFRETPVEAHAAAPAFDQPTLYEWLLRKRLPSPLERPQPFAAILGSPVDHSRTPVEQGAFFATHGLPTLRIAITEADCRHCDPLAVLAGLGLRAAAVTSPHKTAVLGWGGASAPWPRHGEAAVNTLALSATENRFLATSTDEEGLRVAWLALSSELQTAAPAIAVWGGGGVLPTLRAVFAGHNVRYFSARSGTERDREAGADDRFSPQVVVWSVGRSRHAAAPPPDWKPAWVFDVDYSEDSPGREYALRTGARYRDGLAMFVAQAAAQRRFIEQIFSQSATQPERARGDNSA